MKKLLAGLLSAAVIMSQMTAVTYAEDTWAPTATSYTADFTSTDETSKWQPIADADSANAERLTVANGVLTWKTSKEAKQLLPVAKMKNFVIDMDITQTTGEDGNVYMYFGVDSIDATNDQSNKFKIAFQSPNVRASLTYNGTARDTSSDCGYQWNVQPYVYDETKKSDLHQSSRLRLVVYEDKLAAWMNDQLVYSWNIDENYTGGYVGIGARFHTTVVRSLSVREATASDLYFAESFNAADTTNDYTHGDFEVAVLAGGNSGGIKGNNWGSATMGTAGGTAMFIDKNKTVIGDHTYQAGFTFSSSNNGATRFIVPLFGINDDAESTNTPISGYAYGVTIKVNGTIQVNKITCNSTGGFTYTGKNSEGKWMYSADGAAREYFPDKLGDINGTEVLAMDTTWEYRHVLHDGTLDIYLDDVLVHSVTSSDLKGLSGYTGLVQNGVGGLLHYFGIRGVEDADLNRPNQFKIRVAGEDGSYTALADKTVRFYTTQTVDNAVTETLYGTAYADESGLFDIQLGNAQSYVVKVYDTGSVAPIATKSITYTHTGEQTNIDFDEVTYYTEILNVDFADNAGTDSSPKANSIVLYEQAKTEAMAAFGGKEALVLDGVGDAAKINNETAFELDDKDKLTVEAVFIPRQRDGIKEMAVIGGTMGQFSGYKNGFGLYVDQNSDGEDVISFRATVGASNTLYEVDAPCEMNTAYYAAGVYDGTAMRLYINGEEVASKAVSGDICTITTLAPAIGAEWYNLNDLRKYFFKGEIADVYVANGTKTAEEVAETYNEYTAAGYQLGSEDVDDVTASVAFSTETPQKGDTVTVTAAVRNSTNSDKTVTVEMVPGYFAALVTGENTQEIAVSANSIQTAEFTYKLLEGGREPFRVYVYENDVEVCSAVKSLSVIGAGYYKSETHNHSTRSDGTNTFEENVLEGFETKNLSYAFATEHNQYNYWNYKKAADTSALYNPQQFKVFMGAEFTTPQSHLNVYELTNDVSTQENNVNKPDWNEASRAYCFDLISENGALSAAKMNEFIETIENETGGGYLYINHPSDRTYSTPDDIIQDMRGYTGIEIWNGAQTCFDEITLKQRDSWDKANSIGWGHIVGQAGTDAHGSVCYGTIQKVAYLDELSREEITRVVSDGNAIGTNGPEIRFDINGVAMNDTAVATDGKAAFNIDVYDPLGDILEVKLIKNIVSGEFTTDNRTETVLYAKADGADAISTFSYNDVLEVSDGEFYRVEVTTAKTPYGSVSSNGITTAGDGSGMGWAFTNNIWITESGTSNSTNISAIASVSDNVALCELPTGILYLRGSGEFSLDELTVTSDGAVSKSVSDDLITVTVTAEDGSQSVTELYLVGDIAVNAETRLVCTEAVCTASSAQLTVSVTDGECLLEEGDAKLIVAVYNADGLIGCAVEDVTAVAKEKSVTITFSEQTDLAKLSVKAMLLRNMQNVEPLCSAEEAVIKTN
ncbi:MAG: LamG domain-containing protein [Clostridia bacterium]|nr:LamG domain-containing protein [Clostridia bacterium]